MGAGQQAIPFPLSSYPGYTPQESAGRLINCHAEPLGPGGPAQAAYHRSPGLTQFATTSNTGYRGGLIVNNLSYETWANTAATVNSTGTVTTLGTFPGTLKVSIARNLNAAGADVVACDIGNGPFVLQTLAIANATATVTIGGSTFNSGDTVSLSFTNPAIAAFPVTVTHTLGGSETATTVASALVTLIGANSTLSTALLTAASASGVITITQQSAIGNSTQMFYSVTGSGNETVTFSPVGGALTGGSGTVGLTFVGAPIPLSTIGAAGLPTPKAVCFQDGYFHFLTANNVLFASDINLLTFNALTFVVLSAKADVVGQRVIPFSGLIFAFTTGHCEVWQDTAQPYPGYPYSRAYVLNWGLLQENAIAGFETGFDDLLWVAQDYGVYRLPYGSVAPSKVSPPDLDRLIEAQGKAGNVLDAGCYIIQGKKFWTISSPSWTWEFNLGSQQWNERTSLNLTTSVQGRWRASGGHPAFGTWLVGDTQSGAIAFVDDSVITELGSPQLRRIESAPVNSFPDRLRVARADFSFSTGAGIATGATSNIVNPSVAISWSNDNGISWKNPIVRPLGLQGKSLRTRISVKNTGYSGPQARRWRLDDTDCAAPFMNATMDDDPKEK